MTKLTNKIAGAAAAGALVLVAAVPVFANDVEITGNGYNSDNTVKYTSTQTNIINQTNIADIENEVEVEGETGDNEANKNTGGDVEIDTGNVDATVIITNLANKNKLNFTPCCEPNNFNILIKNNGSRSDNLVKIRELSTNIFTQTNIADIENEVEVEGETGENEANKNTGGDVEIDTGDVDVIIGIETQANKNVADVDLCCEDKDPCEDHEPRCEPDPCGEPDLCCEENSFDLDVTIKGNGVKSDSKVKYEQTSLQIFSQLNVASVESEVEAEGETGENEANKNTDGKVKILTGKFNVFISLFTKLNFNRFN